jgi:hypothetical protein
MLFIRTRRKAPLRTDIFGFARFNRTNEISLADRPIGGAMQGLYHNGLITRINASGG